MSTLINKTQKIIIFSMKIKFNLIICLNIIEKPNVEHLKTISKFCPYKFAEF